MATAPRPGVTTRNNAAAAQAKVVTITFMGETKTVTPGNIKLRDSAAIRKATGGLPVRAFLPTEDDLVDLDSFKVLWWLARRNDGEPDLTIEEFEKSWPDTFDPESDLSMSVEDGLDVLEEEGWDAASPQS